MWPTCPVSKATMDIRFHEVAAKARRQPIGTQNPITWANGKWRGQSQAGAGL